MIGRKHDAFGLRPRPPARPARGRAVGRAGDPARRRLAQGEPRRHGRRRDRRGARRRPLRHARARRDAAGCSTGARSTTSRPPRRCCRRGSRSRCAARAWAATSRSSPPSTPGAAAVVAICPAPAPLLARGLRTGRLDVAADAAALEALLAAHPLEAAVAALELPVLIQHAERDEQVPRRRLARARAPACATPPRACRSCPAATTARSSTTRPRSGGAAWLRKAIRGR